MHLGNPQVTSFDTSLVYLHRERGWRLTPTNVVQMDAEKLWILLKVKELIEAGDSLIDFLLGISFPIGSTFLGSQQTVSKRLLVQLRLFYFFLNGPTRASFPFIFGLFKQTLQFLQQIDVKNVHPVYSARIWTHNLSNMSHHP